MTAKSRILAKNLVKKLAIMLASFDYNKYTILYISRATQKETFPAMYDYILHPKRDQGPKFAPSPFYMSPLGDHRKLRMLR